MTSHDCHEIDGKKVMKLVKLLCTLHPSEIYSALLRLEFNGLIELNLMTASACRYQQDFLNNTDKH